MTLGLVALVAQVHAPPGVEGAGITSPEVIVVACALVILMVVPALVHWRR
jgi:hypothetical protein